MGEENSSTDWLPKDWKVEVRVRKSGKKDKCYVDPSNKRKFFSKPEVLRYLKRTGINTSVCEETASETSSRCSPVKFVVKEAVPEGLPAGWIKEIRVTQKGNKVRRDPYYIDPVKGHVFRSMREVSHYLETGKMRKRAPKRKEQRSNNLEVGQDPVSPASGNEEKIIADKEAGKELIGNQSVDAAVADTVVMNNDCLPEAGKLEQRNKKEISSSGSSPAAEVPLENLKEGNGLEASKCKKKKRKGTDLPRRTSKRLAGIEVDLSLESNLPTRVRRATGRQISEVENKSDNLANIDEHGTTGRQMSEGVEKKSDNLANIDEHGKRPRTGNETEVKPESLDALPTGDYTDTIPEGHSKQGVTECEGDQKMEVSPDLPFSELWKDPCIEFAIKTLTGAMPIEDETKITTNEGSSSNLPNVVADSIPNMPSMDFWGDPCFEFAVKTLTSDFPMVYDPAVEAMLKQPSYNPSQTMEAMLKQPSFNSSQAIEANVKQSPGSSSQTMGQNGVMLPSIRSGGFSHASVSFRDSNVAETPQQKQQL